MNISSIDHDLYMSVVVCVIGAGCGQSTEEVNLTQGDINRLSVGHAWLVHTCTEAKLHTYTCTLNHAQVDTQTHTHTVLVTGDFVSLIGVWTGVLVSLCPSFGGWLGTSEVQCFPNLGN